MEQIFHEMGVFDMEGIVTDISPAISPIPPSPAEVYKEKNRFCNTALTFLVHARNYKLI